MLKVVGDLIDLVQANVGPPLLEKSNGVGDEICMGHRAKRRSHKLDQKPFERLPP
jgi:hypothetical protein